jgi:hypothetical protein
VNRPLLGGRNAMRAAPIGTALAYALLPQGCLDGVVTGVELVVVAGFFAFLALVPV